MKYVAQPVEVDAWEITYVSPEIGPPGTLFDLLYKDDQGQERQLQTTSGMTSRMIPRIGDFIVRQSDGYIYLNPRDVFLRKYRKKKLNLISDTKKENPE